MKVKYELDQRKTSGIQFNIDGKKRSFTPKLGDKKIVRTLEDNDALNRAVKSGYLIKHLGNGVILTANGEMKYATYKKQVKSLKNKLASKNAVKVPSPVKKVTAKKADEKAKKEAEVKAEKEAKAIAEKEAKAIAEKEAKARAEKEAEVKAEAKKEEEMNVRNVEAKKAEEAKAEKKSSKKKHK